MEECLCCCKELSLDVLERETDMAVKCEPDRCGLEGLQERHDHLEVRGSGWCVGVEWSGPQVGSSDMKIGSL